MPRSLDFSPDGVCSLSLTFGLASTSAPRSAVLGRVSATVATSPDGHAFSGMEADGGCLASRCTDQAVPASYGYGDGVRLGGSSVAISCSRASIGLVPVFLTSRPATLSQRVGNSIGTVRNRIGCLLAIDRTTYSSPFIPRFLQAGKRVEIRGLSV